MPETLLSSTNVLLFGLEVSDLEIKKVTHDPAPGGRKSVAGQLAQQADVTDSGGSDVKGARFARIYGFSYEGAYYDMPKPMLFLVHGPGAKASQAFPGLGLSNPARAVPQPDVGGVGAADFQFADEIRVWSYDKADYTIRMDVDTGMFEDILLDAMLGGQDGLDARGMNARGMNARGMNARGMNARGMNARGMNARGMNARGGSSD